MRADDHGLWIKAGLALKALGDTGRGLWMEWSLTSEKSQDKEPLALARTWDGFTPTQIDYKFVFAEAQRRGWVNPAKTYTSAQAPHIEDGVRATPQPLPNSLRKVKVLDVGCLPSTIRDAVSDIAARAELPSRRGQAPQGSSRCLPRPRYRCRRAVRTLADRERDPSRHDAHR